MMLTVKQVCLCMNMPNTEIAKQLDVHENTVASWLNGKTDISLTKYQELLQLVIQNIDKSLASSALAGYYRKSDICFISRDPKHPSFPGGVMVDPFKIAAAYVWNCFESFQENLKDGRFPKSEEIVKSVTESLKLNKQFEGEIMTVNQYHQLNWPEELKQYMLDADLTNDYPMKFGLDLSDDYSINLSNQPNQKAQQTAI